MEGQATVEEIDIALVRPNPLQPRETFDPEGLQELRSSIQNHGVLQPILVRRREEGFELIAGERRWRAARLAGLRTVPAIVRSLREEGEQLELALVENLQRRDLDPIEKALGYRRMMDGLGLTQEGVAAKVGLQRATVANHLRLLELSPSIQSAIRQRRIHMGHARAILSLSDEDDRIALMEETLEEGLSVRQVEERARERVQGGTARTPARDPEAVGQPVAEPTTDRPPWAHNLESRLRERLATRVHVVPGEGQRGRIVIEFHDHAELQRLIDTIAPEEPVL